MARARQDFPLFAERALHIRSKDGAIVPFRLNSAQRFIHQRLEEQKQRTGKVRALILKGRQQGCSTLIEGRFYWLVTGGLGKSAYILTHRQDATDNLFGMALRYHQHCPGPLKPSTKKANAKELYFDRLDSGYRVATAGSSGTGRSSTAQYFHGSEVAFWDSAEEHMAGIGQVVPPGDGTEIILETTANGLGNLFHRLWQQAERGEGEYQAIFVPWYWQPEYATNPPAGFTLTTDEQDYASAYNLDVRQMAWRRSKIVDDFAGDTAFFDQEYPASAALAFVAVKSDPLIKPAAVMRARRPGKDIERWGPLIIGVDPARFGDDSTGVIRRQGRVAFGEETWSKLSTMEVAGRVARLVIEEKPDRVFIDVGGLGAGVYDRLVELGHGKVVSPVNFGEGAYGNGYANRRAEMWANLRDWLNEPGGVQIPDSDALHADLVGPQYSYDSLSRLKLERKEDMRKRGLRSPDLGDALALCFAEPVSNSTRVDEGSWRQKLRDLQRATNTRANRSPMAG